MVVDGDTNKLFFSDILPKSKPDFYKNFIKLLDINKINFTLIPYTKDIWAVDFMPIQIETNEYIQFVYNPDYLQSKRWMKTIPNMSIICEAIGIIPKKSNIVLDGGNVIKGIDKVIMCDKVFIENPAFTRTQLIKELLRLFNVDNIYFIPQQPKDYTGHADGMVRFLNDETVLINNYLNENDYFKRALYLALHNAGLNYIEIPYKPHVNSGYATGYYINYLQMEKVIILPTFGIDEDDKVIKQFEGLFPGYKILAIDSNEIASSGGVLNCITWNIKN